jgi:hypothetical protein
MELLKYMANYLKLQIAKKITNKQLEKIILPLNFKKRSYSKYFWFDENQNNSISGCYLYYELPSKNFNKKVNNNGVLTSATYGIVSYEDLQMQNQIILELQKAFDGEIYNPNLNNNQIYKNTLTKLQPVEKKLGLTFYNFEKKLKSFDYFFKQEYEEGEDNLEIQSLLIPFLVSLLESFFYEFYISYLEINPNLLEKILIQKGRLKLNYLDLKNLLEKEKNLTEFLASYYNFQNLYSLDYAFRELMNLELLERWGSKKIGDKSYLETVKNLISQRHKIIHNLFSNDNSTPKNILDYKQILELIVNDFIDLVEKKGYRLRFSKYLKLDTKETSDILKNPENINKSQLIKKTPQTNQTQLKTEKINSTHEIENKTVNNKNYIKKPTENSSKNKNQNPKKQLKNLSLPTVFI